MLFVTRNPSLSCVPWAPFFLVDTLFWFVPSQSAAYLIGLCQSLYLKLEKKFKGLPSETYFFLFLKIIFLKKIVFEYRVI